MNHRESMEEDDMVKSRVGNTIIRRRTDEEDKRATSLKDLNMWIVGVPDENPVRACKDY